MEPTKNGQLEIRLDNLCHLGPLSADGTQWEGRVHMIAHMPDGMHAIGEIVIRTFEGGIRPMDDLIANGFALLRKALVQQRSGLSIVS